MRLLYVTEEVPNRDPVRGDGSSMIPYEVVRALPAGWEVTLVSFEGGVEVPREVADRCAEVVLLPLTSSRWPARWPAVVNLGARARASRASRRAVAQLSANADATLLHGPLSLGLARSVRGPLVVQTVDPWSHALGLEADRATGARRVYWRLRAWATTLAERTLPRRARLLTVGEVDASRWARVLHRPVRSVPNGVEGRTRRPRGDGPPTLCFLGSLDYPPNVESAERLVRHILPLVRARVPDARVLLAGRNPGPSVSALAATDVEVRGDVPEVAEVFDDADVAVFPDRRGTGVRNAVQEALVSGLPVVATAVAARELPPHPARTLAETDVELADAVAAVLTSGGAQAEEAVGVRLRTWAQCAADYVAELDAAVAAAS